MYQNENLFILNILGVWSKPMKSVQKLFTRTSVSGMRLYCIKQLSTEESKWLIFFSVTELSKLRIRVDRRRNFGIWRLTEKEIFKRRLLNLQVLVWFLISSWYNCSHPSVFYGQPFQSEKNPWITLTQGCKWQHSSPLCCSWWRHIHCQEIDRRWSWAWCLKSWTWSTHPPGGKCWKHWGASNHSWCRSWSSHQRLVGEHCSACCSTICPSKY